MAAMRGLMYLGFVVAALVGWFMQKRRKTSSVLKPAEMPVLNHEDPASLKASLRDSRWRVRLQAVRAIQDKPSPENMELLLLALADQDNDVRETAAEALLLYGQDAAEGFRLILEGGPLHSRETLVRLLHRLPQPDATQMLIHALQHDDSAWVRVPAVQALSRMKGHDVEQALIQALANDIHPDVATEIRAALTQMGTPAALKALKQAPE